MGMAASQARYLALTARKTNVEYEGQQINQARTALANQSAELFNQLLGLQTPIPPSVNDYQETFYTYSDGLYDYKVEGWVLNDPTSKFPYDVKVSYDANKYVANQNIMSGVKINQNSDLDTQDKYPYVIMTSTGLKNLRHIDINETDTNSNSYPSDADAIAIETIQTKYTGIDSETEFYSYEQNGTSIYITKSDLEAYINNPYSATSELKTYYAENQTARETKYVKAALIFNDNNQYPTQIVVEDDSANGTSYSLSAQTIKDEDAYNQAINDYEYATAEYEKTIQEINAKTEVIQQQDRTLELRLKQLDTEQEALQTEMESVKKVIDKNIETSFKTFQ